MIINTNITAMKTEGNLKKVNEKNAKALEKLSSGLRINRAADDSAGLSISEKMRSQIRGLNQASRNLQDGISFVQTADGALGVTHNILDRIKELCVQGANDINTLEDRQKINEELMQLSSQIDKMGTDTEFNTLKVFMDGANSLEEQELFEMIAETWVASSLDAIYNTFPSLKNAGANKPMQIVLANMGNNGTMASMSASGPSSGPTEFVLNINTFYFDHSQIANFNNSGGGTPVTGGELYDKIIAHEMMHGAMFDTMWSGMISGDIPSWFVEGIAEAVGGGFYRIAGSTSAAIQNGLNTTAASDYTSGYAASLYLGSLAGNGNIAAGLDAILANLAKPMSFDDALTTAISMDANTFENNFKIPPPSDANTFIENLLNGVNASGGSGSVLTSPQLNVEPDPTIVDKTYPTISAGFFIVDTLTNKITALIIHSGANQSQNMTVNRFGLSANLLGIPTPSTLGTQQSYNNAIKSCDDAINLVSGMRGYYGAVQNRMEYAMQNADISAENMQSAESRIRDANMSLVMLDFTKTNIVSQAAVSMLAQANQIPQNVLTLLR